MSKVINSYFSTSSSDPSGKDIYNKGLRCMEGQVNKIHFIDDASNRSKKFVEYDVIVMDSKGGQTLFNNLKKLELMGGFNDFEEHILESNEFAFSGKLDPSNLTINKNGTRVIIAFLDGSLDKPFIIGALPHLRKRGATRKDGIRKKGEFRGLQWEINKDGELILTYNGNKAANGKLVRANTGPTQIKIDKQGILQITDNKNQKFLMDRTSTSISLTNGTTIKLDGAGDDILIKTAGSGELHLNSAKVALGASGTEVLEQISQSLQAVITLANAEKVHTHIGNLGYPSDIPSTTGDWSTLISALQAIKGLIDGIKGTL